MASIYLAGGLFNAGERLHNIFLESELSALGHKVRLPQRRALEFFREGAFVMAEVIADCRRCATDPHGILVACIDGADADSGTCVEFGLALATAGRAIAYRTDFRTALDTEAGINAMLRGENTKIIYLPCYFTEFDQVAAYYRDLACKIHEAILEFR